MKKISTFTAITAFILTTGFLLNVRAQSKTEILIVADRKADCRGVVAEDCLQVKHLSEESYSLLRQKIQGFKYAAEYFYVLEVQVINSLKLTSNVQYRLKRILAREKSGTKSN